MNPIQRREFLALLGAGVAWPVAARAQSGRPRVVVIMPTFTTTVGPTAMRLAFLRRLLALGWVPGVNVDIDSLVAANETGAVTALISGLARERVDVVIVLTLQMAFAVRSVLPQVPIVVAAAPDPVRAGAAETMAHPGGTITGISLMAPELATKRVEYLVKFQPRTRRLAVLHNPVAAPARP